MLFRSDVSRSVSRGADNVTHCRITFRAQIRDKWYTAESESESATAQNSEQVCAAAMQSGRMDLLLRVSEANVSMQENMTCTDQPVPYTKPVVRVGDRVKPSELQAHPRYRNPFRFRSEFFFSRRLII